MRRIGEGLWHSTAPEVFATFCFGVLDPAEKAFTFVNAGHPFPMLAQANGTFSMLESEGFPLGMDPILTGSGGYTEQRVDLSPGDVLVVYSDGVTEAGAERGGGEMFGEEGLRPVVIENRAGGAAPVQKAICEAIAAFLGDAPPGDDLTLVVIRAKD